MNTVAPPISADNCDTPDSLAYPEGDTPEQADYDRLTLASAHLRDAAGSLAAGDLAGATAALADAVACLDALAALDDGPGKLGSRLIAIHRGILDLAASRVTARLAALVRDGAA